MSILFWTFAPLVVLVLATVWAHWRNRPRGPVDAQDSISEYQRFRAAIEGSPVRRQPARRPRRIAAQRQPVEEIDLRDPVEVARGRVRAS